MTESLKHNFLLAMPSLAGTYFGDTITYVSDHDAEGALGLMINRPLSLKLVELLEQLELPTRANPDVLVMEGGPVAPDHGFVLHSDDVETTSSRSLGNGLMMSTDREILGAISEGRGPRHFLVALGYAGWGAGQLDQELLENAWLTCPASSEILFDTPFEARVQEAASTLGIDFRLMSAQAGHA